MNSKCFDNEVSNFIFLLVYFVAFKTREPRFR